MVSEVSNKHSFARPSRISRSGCRDDSQTSPRQLSMIARQQQVSFSRLLDRALHSIDDDDDG